MGREVVTREEKVAQKIVDMLTDLRLDLDMVGIYFSQLSRLTTFARFETVYESAKEHKDNTGSRQTHYEYIRHLNN
jgi:hypothetical protein